MAKKREKEKLQTKIPNVSLNLDAICLKAENEGYFVAESNVPTTKYVMDDKCIMVMTKNNGWIVIPKEWFPVLVREMHDFSTVYLGGR